MPALKDHLPAEPTVVIGPRTGLGQPASGPKAWNALKPGYVLVEGASWSVMVPTSRLDQINKTLKGTVKS